MVKNQILLVMDPTSEQQPGLARALELARAYEASIELFVVEYDSRLLTHWLWQTEEREEAVQGLLAARRRWLKTYADELTDEGVEVTVDAVWQRPRHAAIIDKARRSECGLIIKSTHQHPILQKLLFTPTDWHLLQHCPVPLLLAKGEGSPPYRKTLAAIDPTHAQGKPEGLDRAILEAATNLRRHLPTNLDVIHCHEPLSADLWQATGMGGFAVPIPDLEQAGARQQELHRDQFNALLDGYLVDAEQRHFVEGAPTYVLPDYVDTHDIDLLVLGMSYHGAFVGGTAQAILDAVPCDILTINVAETGSV